MQPLFFLPIFPRVAEDRDRVCGRAFCGRLFVFFLLSTENRHENRPKNKSTPCAFVTKWLVSVDGRERGLVAILLPHGRKKERLRKGDPHGQSTEKKTMSTVILDGGVFCACTKKQPLAVYCFYFLCYLNVEGESRTPRTGRAFFAPEHFSFLLFRGQKN